MRTAATVVPVVLDEDDDEEVIEETNEETEEAIDEAIDEEIDEETNEEIDDALIAQFFTSAESEEEDNYKNTTDVE